MKNTATAMALACSMAALASAPVVKDGSVTMTQDPSTRLVTINYEIEGEPAIVTVDICTNGVSIGGENLRYFAGDVNRKVSVDSHTCTWRPDKAWPGHLITNGSVSAVVTAWATNAPPPYMVVSLTVKDDITFYADAGSLPGGVTNDVYKTECLVLRHIPAANVRWRMGSPEDEWKRTANEKSHYVTLANDFYLGVYEVTQRQYELMTGKRPSYFTNDVYYATRPVEMVLPRDLRGSSADWPTTGHVVDGSSFFGKLRAQVSDAVAFDLPLEAQWEFACRAGTTSALYTGKELEADCDTSSPNLQEIARFKQTQAAEELTTTPTSGISYEDTTRGTAKVGSYRENGYGLYDMIGNVLEWCLDYWCADVSEINPETGASEATSTTTLKRVKRGGCYAHSPQRLRSAYRIDGDYNKTRASDGFRVCAPVGIP